MLVLAMQFSRDRCGDGVATRPSRSTDCELEERVGETRSTPASGRRRLRLPQNGTVNDRNPLASGGAGGSHSECEQARRGRVVTTDDE